MSQNLKINGTNYSGVDSVRIPKQSGGTADFIIPSGIIDITDNGLHDVENFQTANVKVPVGTGTSLYATKYASGSYIPTSDTLVSSATIPIGFKPKIFIIRNHSGLGATSKSTVTTSFFVLDNNYSYFKANVPDYSPTDTLNSRASANFNTSTSGCSQGSANVFKPTDTGVAGSGSSSLYFRGGRTYVYYAWG